MPRRSLDRTLSAHDRRTRGRDPAVDLMGRQGRRARLRRGAGRRRAWMTTRIACAGSPSATRRWSPRSSRASRLVRRRASTPRPTHSCASARRSRSMRGQASYQHAVERALAAGATRGRDRRHARRRDLVDRGAASRRRLRRSWRWRSAMTSTPRSKASTTSAATEFAMRSTESGDARASPGPRACAADRNGSLVLPTDADGDGRAPV